MKYIKPKKPSNYPVFKGMDLQNNKYLITIGTNGIFIAGVDLSDGKPDAEFTWDELYNLKRHC